MPDGTEGTGKLLPKCQPARHLLPDMDIDEGATTRVVRQALYSKRCIIIQKGDLVAGGMGNA
jgi:hypothetical protein